MELYSINEGNQYELIHYVEVEQSWLNEIQAKYDWQHFDVYFNRLLEYTDRFHKAITLRETTEESYYEYWQKLTRGQKVVRSFLAFNTEVDNGGLYMFFFSEPEYCLSILEVWEELNFHQLKQDYQQVLQEVIGSFDTVEDLRQRIWDERQQWQKLWEAFTQTGKEPESAAILKVYYFKEEFKRELYQKMGDYIEANLGQFIRIKQE
jgi:hypothetical protein